MAAKFTRLTHNIAIQLHLVAESCTICISRTRRPVRKLLDTPSYKTSEKVKTRKSIKLWLENPLERQRPITQGTRVRLIPGGPLIA
jgi:hypothetical protein